MTVTAVLFSATTLTPVTRATEPIKYRVNYIVCIIVIIIVQILTDTSSGCLICHILSWSYDGVCSYTEYNNSVGSEVPQCVLCG